MKNKDWNIRICPQTLEVTAEMQNGKQVRLSAPLPEANTIDNLEVEKNRVRFQIPDKDITVTFQLRGKQLVSHFESEKPGSLSWPLIVPDESIEAYLLPLWEGSYVPPKDTLWQEFLMKSSKVDTLEFFSLPCWGMLGKDYSLTYLITNQFGNEITFDNKNAALGFTFTHSFKKNWKKKEYGFIMELGDPDPVAPARVYRRYLKERNELVTLTEKIRKNPEVEKLLGAPQAYLWGLLTVGRYDIKNWKIFTSTLTASENSLGPSAAKRLWSLLDPETKTEIKAIFQRNNPENNPESFSKLKIRENLTKILERSDFYDAESWKGVYLPEDARKLINTGISQLTASQVIKLNRTLLESVFPPGTFEANNRWGDGVSIKAMEKLEGMGIKRALLIVDGWEGAIRHPEAVEDAGKRGFLIGTYDSYNSIHHPDEVDSWPTAQFDLVLYETGAIVRDDGEKKPGFNKKGYLLSPLVTAPYVKKRVESILENVSFNTWFIDCDAYGECHDDFSPLHPATQEDDMNARIARMTFIRDNYRQVIGSERGVAFSIPVVHFVHGMLDPVISFYDKDLRDKSSPYFLGRNWPPEEPEIMMKQVPCKPLFRHVIYNPQYRLPLYEIAFHDCVVNTHRYDMGSFKFYELVDMVELTELLYMVPPMYNLNLSVMDKFRKPIEKHNAFFSPLHRKAGLLPMTDFTWLSDDRLVQKTVFGDELEMVANFRTTPFVWQGMTLPAKSILAYHRDTKKSQLYIADMPDKL